MNASTAQPGNQNKRTFKPTKKQYQAWKRLYDDHTEEVFFGGGARGGKSVLGAAWLITTALHVPQSRSFMARHRLKDLKRSTLKTFFQVAKDIFQLKKDKDYKYNQQDGIITFYNDSEIFLIELKDKPSDPNFDKLGSLEFTNGLIDEVSQISNDARDVINTRIEHKTHQYPGKACILYCSNPCKNWSYQDFYLPWRDNTLPSTKAFIQALAKDNPYVDDEYIERLKNRSSATQERLLYGNWEYDDDPSKLMTIDRINDTFTNNHVERNTDKNHRYLVADLAMQGRDTYVVMYWEGMKARVIHESTNTDAKQIETTLKQYAEKYGVPRSNIIYDSAGMGNYLESYLKGATAFNSATKAPDNESYKNMRAQCYYKLAELVNKAEIHIEHCTNKAQTRITRELEQVKEKYPADDEKRSQIVGKDVMKDMLGHSPDYADVLAMRMHPIVKRKAFITGI